jgi:hypothetical protein
MLLADMVLLYRKAMKYHLQVEGNNLYTPIKISCQMLDCSLQNSYLDRRLISGLSWSSLSILWKLIFQVHRADLVKNFSIWIKKFSLKIFMIEITFNDRVNWRVDTSTIVTHCISLWILLWFLKVYFLRLYSIWKNTMY